jgi:Bacterial PH domain
VGQARNGVATSRWEDGDVSSPSASAPPAPVVIRISPMAHFAVGFLVLGLLSLVLAGPTWLALLLVIPVFLSLFIIRYRTVADRDTVTTRTLLGSQTVAWDDIDGLRFGKGSWARAQCKDGTELQLPAVTFATLPLLTEASEGRVPNPYK